MIKKWAYYNEHDPFAAAWLRELIKDGLIAPGEVDQRDLQDVTPNDVTNFRQCHFFAGIGGWSYALRLAGWPDDRPVWTGSAPCQPFSEAGKGKGFADERHLWPSFFWLIRQCKPDTIFGEQVSSKAGLAWLDVVATDLESTGYGIGAFDLCAAGAGAFHIRQRLYFVANAKRGICRCQTKPSDNIQKKANRSANWSCRCGGSLDIMENPTCEGEREISVRQGRQEQASTDIGGGSGFDIGDVGNTKSIRPERDVAEGQQVANPRCQEKESQGAGGGNFWADVEWLPCADGKYRPTKPGLFPLANGVSNRVGILRGAGNAIVPQVAEKFIRAYWVSGGCDG
jgi:DNA (cytosine-5)-methyltransferase 1